MRPRAIRYAFPRRSSPSAGARPEGRDAHGTANRQLHRIHSAAGRAAGSPRTTIEIAAEACPRETFHVSRLSQGFTMCAAEQAPRGFTTNSWYAVGSRGEAKKSCTHSSRKTSSSSPRRMVSGGSAAASKRTMKASRVEAKRTPVAREGAGAPPTSASAWDGWDTTSSGDATRATGMTARGYGIIVTWTAARCRSASAPFELRQLEAGEKPPRRRLGTRDRTLLGPEQGRQEAERFAPGGGTRPSGEAPDLSDELGEVVRVARRVLEFRQQRDERVRGRHRVAGELKAVAQVAGEDARRMKTRRAWRSGVAQPLRGAPEAPPDGFRERLLGARVRGAGERVVESREREIAPREGPAQAGEERACPLR